MPIHNNFAPNLPMPGIGVGGIMFNQCGEVLLIKRNQAPACGLWSIPGGRLEPGENLAFACQREVYEETNLQILVTQVVAVVERKLEGFHYVIIDFLAELVEPENCIPVAQSDVAEARWVSPADFDEYKLVEGLAEIILRTRGHVSNNTLAGLAANPSLIEDYILL